MQMRYDNATHHPEIASYPHHKHVKGEKVPKQSEEVGSNILTGVSQNKILEGVNFMLTKERNWKNAFGDGTSGKEIIKIVTNEAQ